MAILPLRIIKHMHETHVPLPIAMGSWEANERDRDVIRAIYDLHECEYLLCDWFELKLIDSENFEVIFILLASPPTGTDRPRSQRDVLGSYTHDLELTGHDRVVLAALLNPDS